jgi:hypothetical protein
MYAISCMTVLYSGVVLKGILDGAGAGALDAAGTGGLLAPGFRKTGFLKDNVGCLGVVVGAAGFIRIGGLV